MQVKIKVTNDDMREIVIAELAEFGFDAFHEDGMVLIASIEKEKYDKKMLEKSLTRYDLPFEVESKEKENWNKLWESNFPMTEVSDRLLIRAPFHDPEKEYPLEIEIMPKMSFGTGHHATTFLMSKALLDMDCIGKEVLDIGTGTGILAILALRLGAALAEGCDVESWAVENSQENALRNGVNLQVKLGTAAAYQRTYDLTLSNINRNVILKELPEYARLTKTGGTWICSGFYDGDQDAIRDKATPLGFRFVSSAVREGWCCMIFEKH